MKKKHLYLKFPPDLKYANQHAEYAVQAAKQVTGVDLNYTPESIKEVDEIVEQIRKEGMRLEEIADILFGFGCYVGEVFVRNNNAKWVKTEKTPMRKFAGAPMIIELRKDSLCNPIDKVFKRFENGETDNLSYFYYCSTKG